MTVTSSPIPSFYSHSCRVVSCCVAADENRWAIVDKSVQRAVDLKQETDVDELADMDSYKGVLCAS